MFGRRVTLSGLGAADLNGRSGRCGAWDPAKGRYTISLGDGARIVAIKPERLQLLPALPLASLNTIPQVGATHYSIQRRVIDTHFRASLLELHGIL